jgi:predicted Zn-dependent peptidase
LRDQIRRLVEEGISEHELRRVEAQVIAAQVFAQDSVFYQAMRIGALDTVGLPYDSVDRQLKKLQEVSVAQVREVARKYLVDDNLTVAVLDPQRLGTGARPRPKAETAVTSKQEILARLLCTATLVFSAVAQAALPVQQWQTASGARVLFVETHDLPMLDVAVDFRPEPAATRAISPAWPR